MKFRKYVRSSDAVVDFGCGGGWILRRLNCAQRYGVEINEEARRVAETIGSIRVVERSEDLPDGVADVIISNHALEHCASPFAEISKLIRKMKPGALFICYVPHEGNSKKWSAADVNKHLYTWNPMTLGNLFSGAGYQVVKVCAFHHLWPPFYGAVSKLGRHVFDISSYVWGAVRKDNSQVKIIARAPLTQATGSLH